MNMICKECPIQQLVEANGDEYKEGWGNGLFLQTIQGLSGQMIEAVRGTAAGLTDDRIEEIRQEEVKSWGVETEEAQYLEAHPALAKAVHDCEMRIQLGQCVLHSIPANNVE